MTRLPTARCAAAVAAAAFLSLTACDTSHLPVSLPESGATLVGTVKYGTEDIHYAMIMVQSPGGTAYGRVDESGRYRVPNVPVGEVKVAVNTSAARGDYQTAMMAAGAMTGGPEGKAGRKKVSTKFVDVPSKYFDPATSGVSTTVARGENTFDITLPK
jgi:hypothetical protein